MDEQPSHCTVDSASCASAIPVAITALTHGWLFWTIVITKLNMLLWLLDSSSVHAG